MENQGSHKPTKTFGLSLMCFVRITEPENKMSKEMGNKADIIQIFGNKGFGLKQIGFRGFFSTIKPAVGQLCPQEVLLAS